ncbi:hypothetical protein [Photobacterium leiognathi]|uniref:hypothetical protein n=1 Tax=Photobacterium leiognathi TaxID=553611 RepID=UPI002739F45D|nr:hypothetical protein [Photobacterium leiognathi]
MTINSQPVSYRLAFFFQRELQRPDKIFWNLGNEISEFDDVPTVQPLPQGVSIDGYPSIIFRSQNGMFACEIGSFRFDLIVTVGARFGTLNPEVLYQEFRTLSQKVFGYLKENLAIGIDRIGMVSENFIDSFTGNAVNDISRLANFEINSELREINLRFNRVNSINGIELNDIITYELGRLNINGTSNTGIKFTKDVNNIVIQDIPFDYSILEILVNALADMVSPNRIMEDVLCQNPQV